MVIQQLISGLLWRLGAGFCVVIFSGAIYGNMLISPLKMTLDNQRADGLIKVYSKTDSVQYIQVKVKRIVHPAQSSQREEVASPLNGTDIIASPQRFILPAGGVQSIRLIAPTLPNTEQVYRAYVTAVAPGQDSPQSRPQVSVNIGWGAVVRVLPAQQHIALSFNGRQIVNAGNVGVLITSLVWCATETECSPNQVSHSLFPGMKLTTTPVAAHRYLHIRYRLPSGESVKKRWQL